MRENEREGICGGRGKTQEKQKEAKRGERGKIFKGREKLGMKENRERKGKAGVKVNRAGGMKNKGRKGKEGGTEKLWREGKLEETGKRREEKSRGGRQNQ
jgi:hypothetical protein